RISRRRSCTSRRPATASSPSASTACASATRRSSCRAPGSSRSATGRSPRGATTSISPPGSGRRDKSRPKTSGEYPALDGYAAARYLLCPMAEPERAGDRAVARLGEMLALTLMLPLGDGLYRGDPITLSEIALFCGGALAAVAGETWPSIRGRLSNQFSVSVSRAASNFYLWLLLLAFVYGVFAVREPRPIPVLVLFTLIWGVLVGTIFLRRRPAGALAVPESVPPESAKPDPFLIHDRVGWYADGRRDVNSEMVVEGPLCPHDRCDLFCRVTFDPNRDRKAAEDGDNIGIGTHRL